MQALLLTGMLATFSCQDDMNINRPTAKGNEIAFTIAGDSTWQNLSRSVQQDSRHFITLIGNDSVFLQLTEEENTSLPFAYSETDTRGTSLTTENLNSFTLFAYLNNATEFISNQSVTKTNTAWEYSPVKYWPNNEDDNISFYGYARSNSNGTFTGFSINKNDKSGSFSYTLPTTDNQKKDAENQPDLIFAITPNQTKPDVNTPVELVFHHALSAILFKMGKMPDGVTITSISLKNVSTTGNCKYQLANGRDISFTWSNTSSNGNYTQSFNQSSLSEGTLITGSNQLFMMIPQNLDKAVLEISFTINGKSYTFQRDLKDFCTSWEADKKYTYTISTTEYVEVEVSDQCTATIKSNVQIQNTGLSDAYIRAAIVGYWENAEGNVVEGWELSNTADGEMIWGTDWNSYWLKGSDGFYYYKYPVKIGESPTKPLFDQYELKKAAPYTGATLKLNIVVQAVKYEAGQTSLKAAWKAAPNEMSATFETSSE